MFKEKRFPNRRKFAQSGHPAQEPQIFFLGEDGDEGNGPIPRRLAPVVEAGRPVQDGCPQAW
jgi:hypothetical protein